MQQKGLIAFGPYDDPWKRKDVRPNELGPAGSINFW